MSKLTLVLITALLVCVPLEAATRTVDDDGGADFTSIQPAIDASSAGDMVYVFPGTYDGPIVMKDEVNLFGYGPHVTTIDGQGLLNHVVTYNGVNGAVISGFRITGSSSGWWAYSGVYCQAGPLTVKNNIIEGNHGGVSVLAAGNPTIINNTIVGNINGIILGTRVSSPSVTHIIMNNIIVNNSQTGIFYYVHSTDGDILYNDVWGNPFRNYHDNDGGISFAPLPGTGEISADPLFVDTVDYFLGDGSPCRDTGHPGAQYLDPDATRNDMGAYGGPQASGRGSHPGSGFIFTSIGNIPTSEIEQDSGHPSHALAVVDAATASDLQIPAYADAPFGATLRIHGLFGETDIANGVRYYQILLAPWDAPDDPPEPEDYEPLAAGLSKVEYIPQLDGTVLTQVVTLGPQTISGITNLYELTYEGWWSQIDVRMIWNTRNNPNGKYTLTYKAYRYHPLVPGLLVEYFPTANDLDHIDLLVNNSSVQAVIHNVKYDTTSPHWSKATDGEIPECGIIYLQNDAENLRFNITASHPDGYLRRWVLDALWGKNNYAGVIASQNYPGTVPPNDWPGVSNAEFNSEDGSLTPWQPCAYQFRLRAYTRATNGYGYLTSTDPIDYSESFSDHYFIDLGGSCAWCGGADINRDGTVDMQDLAIMGLHYLSLTPCGPDCPE